MNDLINIWIPCENGNPEDFKKLDEAKIMIGNKPCGYIYMFVIKIGNEYSNSHIYKIAERTNIANKWRWHIPCEFKIIDDNSVKEWYMLPYNNG